MTGYCKIALVAAAMAAMAASGGASLTDEQKERLAGDTELGSKIREVRGAQRSDTYWE